MLKPLGLRLIGQCSVSSFNLPDMFSGKHYYYPCFWTRKLKSRSLLRSHGQQAAKTGLEPRQAGVGLGAHNAMSFCLLSSMVPGHPSGPCLSNTAIAGHGGLLLQPSGRQWFGEQTTPLSSHTLKDDSFSRCLMARGLRSWTAVMVLS